jgi:hypothetical protein
MTGVDGSRERRACRRYPFSQEVALVTSSGSIKARANDIGLGGAALEAEQLPVGARLTMELPLPDPFSSSSMKLCRVQGEVVWAGADQVGVQFTNPDDELIATLGWFAKRFFRAAGAADVRRFIDSLFEESDEPN